MTKDVQVEYQGVTITYNESRDEWVFVLRDRERIAETLAKAKDIIDRPPPKPKSVFQRFKCWVTDGYWGSHNLVPGEVTGLCSRRRHGGEVNVRLGNVEKGDNPLRSFPPENVFPSNEHNDAIAKQVIDKQAEIKALKEQIDKLKKGLKAYVVRPEYPEDDV